MAETPQPDLMSIGQFSNLARLSVRMLRHYDAHGVLVPADVDPTTGYRRYASSQLRDAVDIRNPRDAGFGVAAIAALLPARGTDAWTHALELQREALAEELTAARGRLALIEHLLTEGEPSMSISLTRKTVPAFTALTLRGIVPTYDDEGQLWARMMPLVQAAGLTPTGPCGVIEHDDEYTEHDVDLAILFPVAPGTTAPEGTELIELPARDCLVATVVGPYSQISAAHDAINERVAAEGLSFATGDNPADKGFNLYLTAPGKDEEAQVTEVCVPLA